MEILYPRSVTTLNQQELRKKIQILISKLTLVCFTLKTQGKEINKRKKTAFMLIHMSELLKKLKKHNFYVSKKTSQQFYLQVKMKLTYAILPGKPVEPVVRGVFAVKRPFDLKLLCRRHSSAEALDSQ